MSARNRADRLLAGNIRAHAGQAPAPQTTAPTVGGGARCSAYQPDGLQVFAPSGTPFRFPAWSIRRVLQPWIVRRGIYRGVRRHP